MWGEPVVCHYLTTMQDVVSEISLVEEKKESTVVKKKKSRMDSMKRSMEQEQRQSMFQKVVRKDTLVNVFRPTLISKLRQSKHQLPGVWVAPIHNFPLVKQLTHMEIRQLERYGIPRVISSLKFPLEVIEELEQLHDQRPRTKNMLMRRRSTDIEENIDYGYVDFSFQEQHAPERVFPVFTDIETVQYRDPSLLDEDYCEEKTMYGLLRLFDNIRMDYVTQYEGIMNQADFQSKKAEKMKKTVVPVTEARLPSRDVRQKSQINRPGSRHSSIRGSHLGLTLSSSGSRTGSSFHMGENSSVEELSISHVSSVDEEKEEKPKIKVIHWTTKHIISTKFNRKERTVTVKTDRLGVFGLAFKRYEHFPFRDWSMQPNEEK